jgi:hypothetical protein
MMPKLQDLFISCNNSEINQIQGFHGVCVGIPHKISPIYSRQYKQLTL